jgi:AcrR family transcriptional regulator
MHGIMGINERKLREKESRIKQIRDSSAALFYKKGYVATTIEDIAAAAEISKGTIYLYFKSKDDLYYSLVEPSLDKLSKKLITIAGMKEIDPEIRIKNVVDATYEFYDKDPDAYHLVSRYEASIFSTLLSKDKLDHLKDLMRSNLNQLEIVISDGVIQGRFRKLDPRMTSIIIWNTFMGIIQFQENRLEEGKTDYRRTTIDGAVEIILKGIRKR